MIHDAIFNYYRNKIGDTYTVMDIDKELFYNYFEYYELPKNTLYQKQGEIPEFQNFVVSGFMRKFYTDDNGDEVTVEINREPRFMSSYSSLIERIPATESLQSITECKILRIKRDDLEKVFENSTTVKQYTVQLFQKIIEEKSKKVLELATLSGEERYLKLMKESPDLIKNVPLQYIASFLGMKPESLSRIRKKVSK
ncbi:MAG: Crp/Fnr family transcriptional regulator [Limnohabitans sp.]|nr:Crp/Fnr family transcriptional regulator [Limnohabitans sp.]